MAPSRSLLALLLLAVKRCTPWDAALTEKMFGEQNAEAAKAAEEAGDKNWTEMGVGVDSDGTPYLQSIARGTEYKHIRAGLLLVATSQITGEIFEQSVVLLVKHDANGTLGLVLNKPAQLPADEHLDIAEVIEEAFSVAPIRNTRATEHLLSGGPVGREQVLYLHSGKPAQSTRRCYSDSGGAFRLVGSNGEPLHVDDRDDALRGLPADLRMVAPQPLQEVEVYRSLDELEVDEEAAEDEDEA